MNVKRLNDLMYLAIWILEDWKNYFSRNNKNKIQSKADFEEFKKDIKAPEVSEYGLEKRLIQLRAFDMNLIFYGVILLIPSVFITFFLSNNIEISALVSTIIFYLPASACAFSFRVSIAAFNLKKYKNMLNLGIESLFITDNKAIPRLWDLIPGIFICFLHYHVFISIVYF